MPILSKNVHWGDAQVQGDAFLARVFDNEDEFKRMDFTLREVSSGAPWVKVGHLRLLYLCLFCMYGTRQWL